MPPPSGQELALSQTRDAPVWGGRLFATLAMLLLAAALCAGISTYSYKAAVAVAGVFVGGLILWNPFIGLLVVVASLPFETLGMLGDPEQAGAISVTKIGGLLTLAAIVIDALLRRRPIAFSRLANKLSLLVCLLAAVTVLSALRNWTAESSRESVRFITVVMFYLVTILLVNSEGRLRRVIVTWVLIATVVSIYSLYERQFGAAVGSAEWSPESLAGTVIDVSEEDVGVMVRAAGTFSHPGWLALYLSVAFPLTLWMIWTAPRALMRVLWIVALGLQAGAILATYSRTSYLATGIGVVIFLVRRRGGPAVLLWAALLTLATSPLWPDNIKARIRSILDYTESSSSVTRLGQQLVGWWMFRDHMLTGVGPGNFEDTVRHYVDRVPDRWRVEVIGAHNMYVEMLAELGVQGVILVVLIILGGWVTAERARARAPNARAALMYEALGVSLIVFTISAVLIHAQYQKEWWLLLALITSAGWVMRRQGRSDARPRTISRAMHAAPASGEDPPAVAND